MEDYSNYELYKQNPSDLIWWVDITDRIGEFVFTFDKKTFFNFFRDYPEKLTKEQKEIFDKENSTLKELVGG